MEGVSRSDDVDREVLSPKKVVKVGPYFANHSSLYDQLSVILKDHKSKDEKAILKAFEDAGYVVVRGQPFNERNPEEIGIGTSADAGITPLQRDEIIADSTGATMPKIYSLDEILDLDVPVVAKDEEADRGESKYLLTTREQRVRFLTWLHLGFNITNLSMFGEPREVCQELKDMVNTNSLDDNRFLHTNVRNWRFQQYVAPPSSYNTSIRVLADAFGKIHYALFLRSEEETGQSEVGYKADHVTDDRVMAHMQMAGVSFEYALVEKRSPFYIDSYKITSNTSRGGKVIKLGAHPVTDEVDRMVLEAHGISPDRPNLPEELQVLSARIGIASRADFPYVGVDFLPNEKNGWYFLEANPAPAINIEAADLPAKTTPFQAELSMIRKVLEAS